jgi:AcrR family transcriptional regulator
MARTQEDRRAETRRRLLEAAADLFARKGFHATSAEAVASAANRTTGALYDHFGGKEGLLVALVDLWVGELILELDEDAETATDIDGRVGELWRGLIRRDAESGDAWLLLEFELWLHAARDPEVGIAGAQRLALMRSGLEAGLVRWSDEFGFDLPAPPAEIAMQVIALLLGAVFQHRLEPAVATQAIVVDGLRRLIGASVINALPPSGDPDPPSRGATP